MNLESVNECETMAEVAATLAEYGFSVIPCGGYGEVPTDTFLRRNDGNPEGWTKTPRISWKGWQTTVPPVDQVRAWWKQYPRANPAILTGNGLVVVDTDDQDAIVFIEQSGFTRTPFVVETGKGRHYYYQNKGLDIRNSAKQKLDVRGDGGYVISAGAFHSSGKRYRLILDPLFDWQGIDDLPVIQAADMQAIKSYQSATAEPVEGVLFNTGDVQGPHNGEPVDEGGRNVAAASLIGQHIDNGYSMQDTKALLDQWNQSNPSPLSQSEINQTIASVATTHIRNNPGKVIEIARPATRDGLRIYSAGEITDNPPPRPRSLWKGPVLFDRARVVLGAPPKTLKSFLALDLGVGLATGTDCLGSPCAGPVPVVWLQAEINSGFIAERLQSVTKGLDPADMATLRENLYMTGRLDLDITNPLDRNKIIDRLRPLNLAGGLLILDPIINFSTADENNNNEVKAMLRQVDQIADELGCGVLLVHHTRKGAVGKGASDPFEALRGASSLRGYYDTGIILSAGEGGIVASYECRNGIGPKSHGIQLNESTGRIEMFAVDQDGPGGMEYLPEDYRLIADLIPEGRDNAIDTLRLKIRVHELHGKSESWTRSRLRKLAKLDGIHGEKTGNQHTLYWREK